MAKNIIAKSQEIESITRIVPLISTFFSSSCRSSRCVSGGKVRVRRWTITAIMETILMPTAQSMPSRPMMSPENTDTTVKVRPLTTPICPFALSRSHSGMSIVTMVERAIIRILPKNTPSIDMRINPQSQGLFISPHVDSGRKKRSAKEIL